MWLQVIAESLSEEEIAGLKEMFKMLDTDNSGHITLEELKTGLQRVGANLMDSEIDALMEAVSILRRFLRIYSSFILKLVNKILFWSVIVSCKQISILLSFFNQFLQAPTGSFSWL